MIKKSVMANHTFFAVVSYQNKIFVRPIFQKKKQTNLY